VDGKESYRTKERRGKIVENGGGGGGGGGCGGRGGEEEKDRRPSVAADEGEDRLTSCPCCINARLARPGAASP
jgi:hypothetical protein